MAPKEKTLLVIGASSDIGMDLIRREQHQYARVIAHYRTMNDRLETLQKELGDRLMCLQADLGSEADTRRLVEDLLQTGIVPTHIVLLPAQITENQRFNKIPWETWQRGFDISIRSAVLILQALLPKMAKNRYGRVIIMLSMMTNGVAPAYMSDYVVTKYAMLGLMKSLASEYAEKGITVNGVSPAMVRTKFIEKQPDLMIEKHTQASPIGRILETADILPGIAFLLSEGAECVNGQNLTVTCGR